MQRQQCCSSKEGMSYLISGESQANIAIIQPGIFTYLVLIWLSEKDVLIAPLLSSYQHKTPFIIFPVHHFISKHLEK